MSSDFSVDAVTDRIVRLALPPMEGLPEPVDQTNNVYLVRGEAPALINAGHPTQFEALAKAIQSADDGIGIADIERIIHTSWSINTLAGTKNFPDVDHFVFSPDMVEPRAYPRVIDRQRQNLLDLTDALRDREAFADEERSDVEDFLARYYPPVPDTIDFIPVRSGHVIRAGDFELEVIASPGPAPGHMCLFEADEKLLFSGDFSLSGLPDDIHDVQSYFVSLERLVELDSERVLPNRGKPRRRGKWTLQNAHRFVNNFMSNAPQALFDEPTLVEFVRRDWGYTPDNFAETVLKIRVYRSLLDELVRSRMIEAEGEGLDRRYGTDVDDPREKVRKTP